jgi:hypothetical protein
MKFMKNSGKLINNTQKPVRNVPGYCVTDRTIMELSVNAEKHAFSDKN